MNLRQLVLVGATFWVTGASAQEACPGGTQVGQNCGGGYCVPICVYDEQPQAAQTPPPRVVERWEVFDRRYGAWANEPSSGALGVSFGQLTAEAAEREAIADCVRKGEMNCKVIGTFSNTCSTAAWGGGILHFEGAPTAKESEQLAVEQCEKSVGVPCDVIQTACSRGVSRWVYEKPPGWEPAER
jgi:hypothetical protein